MKSCVIVNSRSGGWDRWQRRVQRLATESSVQILSETADQPLRKLLDDALRQGFRRFVVAGGDGTLSRIVNLAATRLDEMEFALMPLGTGNDLARSIGVFGHPLEQIWHWALTRSTTPIDLVKVANHESSYLVNAATGGFGGAVSTDVRADDKLRWGAIAYWMTAFSKLVTLDEFDLRLELDSETVRLKTYGLAIANGRYVGGGFPVAPQALVNDGLLNVTTVPVLPPVELLAAGIDFTLSRYDDQLQGVRTYCALRVGIHAEPILPYSFDGDPYRSIDATFQVLPGVLRLVCGPAPPAVLQHRQPGHSVPPESNREDLD